MIVFSSFMPYCLIIVSILVKSHSFLIPSRKMVDAFLYWASPSLATRQT